MKRVSRLIYCLTLLGACGYAQAAQAPATPDELKYFRYLLMTLGSLDYRAEFVAAHENALVPQFGLNAQEAAVIHSAAQSLHSTLQEIRQSANGITAAKHALTPTELSALTALAARRDQAIATLANQILNSVRPVTAARLRAAGDLTHRFTGH
jgi:hypothetical protein